DTVATCAFTVVSLRGSINREVYPYHGTLALRGTITLPGLLNLWAFTNTAQSSLLTLSNGKKLGSGTFVRSNKAGTLLTFRSRIKEENWRLVTTLRLKKTGLQVSLSVCNEPDLDHGLNTVNQDTDGWLPHTVTACVRLHDDDQTLIGVGTYQLREKSQMDKKTIYK
ncbi:MAG: hypothetical protein NTV22_07405, partial [bacterium]|nr:hypothetical protein [bacterium]